MRKVIAMFAIATLAACGGGVSNNPTTDSATQTVDTAKATTTDSAATTVEAPKVEAVSK